MRYRNISDQEQILTGIGVVAPGAIIKTDQEISNPNFEETTEGVRKVGVDSKTEPKKGEDK